MIALSTTVGLKELYV